MVMYRAIPRPQAPQPKPRRKVWLWLGVGIGAIVLVNLLLALLYGNRTYPRTNVAGKAFGNVAFAAAPDKLQSLPLLPETIQVDYGNGAEPVRTAELGITIDYQALQTDLRKRSWLPMANLLRSSDMALELNVDDAKMGSRLEAWAQAVASQPVDANIEQQPGLFKLVSQKNGRSLDRQQAKAALLAAVGAGGQSVTIKPRQQEPAVTDTRLAGQYKSLKTAQNQTLTYTYGSQKQTASPADIVSWYRKDGNAFVPSIPEIKAYIASLGAAWQARFSNMDAAVAATRQALDGGQPLDFKLQGSAYAAPRTFTYCTAVRGVDASYLTELNRKLATAYADERGWSLGGIVRYARVATGCDFTVWLSAANQMAGFGTICDPEWSCTVRPNVVINIDRWVGASAAWNAAGGNLNDYDSMVINHETGHWLGFDHVNCPAGGQPAPVMQQQSVNLQGCTFNPWPTAGEQSDRRTQLGV